MTGSARRDLVVAELDELRGVRIPFCLLEDEPHAAVALLVGQDLITVAGITSFERPAFLVEGQGVAVDGNALDVCPVADVVIGLVFGSRTVAVWAFFSITGSSVPSCR